MYAHTIEPFGSFEKHSIIGNTGNALAVVPQFGANLIELIFNGKNVLDAHQTPEQLAEGDWGKSIILFPFPNRLRDGQYQFDGKNYQFAINNADTNNAIHGFGFNAPLTVANVWTAENEGGITCQFVHDGGHAAYPFRFTFEVDFVLRGLELVVEMRFTNQHDSAIPVGLGWHPYFRISDDVADTWLQMPESQMIAIDARMIPTGEKMPFHDFDTLRKIDDYTLDNGFFITQAGDKASVILQSDFGQLDCWQEIGPDKWNFVQVFTPPHRNSIAVEPMTSNIDAFNNGDGLKILAPNDTLGGRFGVAFTAKTA